MKDLYHNESKYRLRYGIIGGVDEAGRGPLAGPLVVSACILPEAPFSLQLNDSKQIMEKDREILYGTITANAVDYALEVISAAEIDRLNIFQATMKGMLSVLCKLTVKPAFIVVDGNKLPQNMPYRAEAVVKGDGKFASIAAASILAKVTRDRIMREIDKEYSCYGFLRNKGYPTKEHLQSINRYGICQHHRRSFKPVKRMLSDCEQSEIVF